MPGLKTELKARVGQDTRETFRQRANARGTTESELLRALVMAEIGKDLTEEKQPETNQEKIGVERITVRMPSFLMQAAKEKGKAKGMAPSRWITALVQSNLAKKPVMADQELLALKANIRELTAIGRNINQMARALNESRSNTEKVRLDMLALLDETLKTNLSLIRDLVRASQQAWEAD